MFRPFERRIFVLSDWHLGGVPDTPKKIGTQICRSATHLTTFIRWVTEEAKRYTGITEVVINGDMVDFLAPGAGEPPTTWMANQAHAITRLEQLVAIARGGEMEGPFEALGKFLEQPRTELTVALGNHDVELSLPAVRQHLSQIFGDSSRFRMAYDGEAIVRGRVLIEHGNRYDSWNALNFNGLREERSHLSRGLVVEDARRSDRFFTPPAGTLMVIYAINTVLDQAPFINLLKPETSAALPLLIAIEPNLIGVLRNILNLVPVLPRLQSARLDTVLEPANRDNLTGAGAVGGGGDPLAAVLRPLLGADTDMFLKAPLSPLGGSAGLPPLEAIKARVAKIAEQLRAGTDFGALITDAKNEVRWQLLRRAFRALQNPTAFQLDQESPEYMDAAKALLIGGKFDVVVFGHTHLQKRISVPREGMKDGLYFNAGTWADTMKLPDDLWAEPPNDRVAFNQFFENIKARRVGSYLFTTLGYVEIELTGADVKLAELRTFSVNNPRAVPLARVQ